MKTKILLITLCSLLTITHLSGMWDRSALLPSDCKNKPEPYRLPPNMPRQTNVNGVDGAEIWSSSVGYGKPVVIVHGGPGLSHDYLMPHMEQLARKHKVIFYDQRGCGQSTGCEFPETISMDQYVKDLEQIRVANGGGQMVLIGHSWGGLVAMNYATTYPNHVDKLVLMNSIPATSDGFTAFADEYARRTAPFQDKLDALVNSPEFADGDPRTTEEYYRIVFRTYVYDTGTVDQLNLRMTPEAILNGRTVSQAFFEDYLSTPYDLRSKLRFLNMPTLVIHGDVDPIPAYTAEEIYKNIPGAKYILFTNSGHFPYIENPQIFFDAIETFIQ